MFGHKKHGMDRSTRMFATNNFNKIPLHQQGQGGGQKIQQQGNPSQSQVQRRRHRTRPSVLPDETTQLTMISKYSLRLIKLTVWICALCWISETKWVKKKGKFVTKETFHVPLMFSYQITARFIAITYFSLFLLLSDNPILSWDFRLGIAWLFQCLVTTPWWWWTSQNLGFWGFLFNQTIGFNKNMANFHERPAYVKKDGTEAILTTALIGCVVIGPLAPILAFFILHYRNPAITEDVVYTIAFVFNTSVTTANVIVALMLAYHLMFDIVLIMSCFVWSIVIVNCSIKWLQTHMWTLEIYNNQVKRQQMRLLYRQVQVVYKWPAERSINSIQFALSIVAANLYISFGMFFFIRSLDSDDHSFFYAQGLVTVALVVGIKMLLETLNTVTESSTLYVTSLKDAVPRMMKYEQCYLRSCSPFKWFMGSMFMIDHQTFVWVMTEFTFSMLLSLLQAF